MFLETLFTDPILYVQIIAIVIFSICLHELAHGFVALTQGDNTPLRTGHMTLNPVVHMGWDSLIFLCIGGVAWGTMPVNPLRFRSRWGDVLVSAAGPLSNLALGFLFTILYGIAIRLGLLGREIFHLVAYTNFFLCLFNLLPIPPLDGFQVFRKFFPELKILDQGQMGLFVLMVLIVTGFVDGLGDVSLFLIRAMIGSSI